MGKTFLQNLFYKNFDGLIKINNKYYTLNSKELNVGIISQYS
ncbi:hypothetical protein EV194_101619 [Natronoflexus pectinivorans]|uniref:Uncharacterized protein n=1 Tax=Natronoflexus pectinivorans TaxID=682526 RepID=A0A4R2GNU1_9BACT|nr:hypothetical protein EV194_101619 [Natronoflexus pectinivorans]